MFLYRREIWCTAEKGEGGGIDKVVLEGHNSSLCSKCIISDFTTGGRINPARGALAQEMDFPRWA